VDLWFHMCSDAWPQTVVMLVHRLATSR
jgi:hypothetical protein